MATSKSKKKKVKLDPVVRFINQWGKIIVFGLGFLLYANTLFNGYTQDDAIVITDNMLTQQGFSGIPELLSKDTFYGFFKEEGKSRLVAGGRYRPLTLVMFAMEYQVFGQQPWIGHLVNTLLFALTGLLLFVLISLMAKGTALKKSAPVLAFAVAVLYVAHPIHTEAVANIKGRDEIMSFLLATLSMLVLLRNKQLNWKTSGLAGLCFFLALLSKENAITYLAVIPLALYMFMGERAKGIVMKMLPLLASTLIFLWIRGLIIGWDLGDPPRELLNNPFIKIENNAYVDFTFSEKYATIMYTLGKYVQLLFFPHPLTHDYYPRHIEMMSWSDWQVILSLVAYFGLALCAVIFFKRRPLVSFGILFYLITLSIVSNVIFPVGTNMSERFMYMPSFGWAISIGALLTVLYRQRKTAGMVLFGLIIAGFCVKTVARNTVWKSNYTLFTTDIKTSARSAKLLAACGGEIITRASSMEEGPSRDALLREGVDYLVEAQNIHPNYKMSYLLRGNGHYYLKEWDLSIASFQRVVDMDPGSEEALKNLGVAYRDAGKYYGQELQDYNKAIQYLRQAVQYLPEEYEAVHSLGVAYGLSGQSVMAVEMFRKGVELAPDNAMAHFNLGLAYQRTGDVENAQKHREIALELDPDILNRRSNNQ